MNKNLCQFAQDEAVKAINEAFSKNPALKGLTATSLGGSFNNQNCNVRFMFSNSETLVPMMGMYGRPLNDQTIHDGYAISGTPIKYRGNGGVWRKGTIIKARTKNYLFVDEIEKKNFVIPFYLCYLDETRMPQNDPVPNNPTESGIQFIPSDRNTLEEMA